MFVSVYGAVYLIGPRSCETALAGWVCHSFILFFFSVEVPGTGRAKRPCSGGTHRWSRNGAIPQFYRLKCLGKTGPPYSFFCHFREVVLWTSLKVLQNKIQDFFCSCGELAMVVLWLTMLLSRKKRPGLTPHPVSVEFSILLYLCLHRFCSSVSPKMDQCCEKKNV